MEADCLLNYFFNQQVYYFFLESNPLFQKIKLQYSFLMERLYVLSLFIIGDVWYVSLSLSLLTFQKGNEFEK